MGYYETPRWLALSKAMVTSGAAGSPTMGAYDLGASIRFLMMHANANLGTWMAFPSKNLKKVRTIDMMIMISVYMLLFQGHEQQQLDNVELGHVCIMTAFVVLLLFIVCSFFRYEIFRWTQFSPMIRSIHSVTGHNYVNSRPPPMLNLTDGGHVDNLGILPLIWRKCDVILCSDAGADPELEWWSICNALGIASENGLIRLKKCPKILKDCTEVSNWCSERVKKWQYSKQNLCLVVEFEYVDALCQGYGERLKDAKIILIKMRGDLPHINHHGDAYPEDNDDFKHDNFITGHVGCCCACCEESSCSNCGMCGTFYIRARGVTEYHLHHSVFHNTRSFITLTPPLITLTPVPSDIQVPSDTVSCPHAVVSSHIKALQINFSHPTLSRIIIVSDVVLFLSLSPVFSSSGVSCGGERNCKLNWTIAVENFEDEVRSISLMWRSSSGGRGF